MKSILLIFISLFLLQLTGNAQIQDSTLKKKLSINGFCLCKATLSGLKQLDKDLREVDVEEMNLPKNCYGQDSRFIDGKGYRSDKYPGLIFQKDRESDFFSKIRFTKQFKGNLPDGNYVNLNTLLLKDLFKLYPFLKDKWGSRGCSDYWNFSNDTLSFFVKIDKSKKPQFPIDEVYYMDKPVEAIDLVTSCDSIKKDDAAVIEANIDPIFFMDSLRIDKAELMKLQPDDVASITVYKDTSAIKILGEQAKNGLIYIETKKFAKHRYWNYFRLKSAEYGKIISSPDSDSNVQYILNKRVLKDNFEGDLATIDDKTFKGIHIINKEQLIKDYGITNKEYGIIIDSDVPVTLKNGKSKF